MGVGAGSEVVWGDRGGMVWWGGRWDGGEGGVGAARGGVEWGSSR